MRIREENGLGKKNLEEKSYCAVVFFFALLSMIVLRAQMQLSSICLLLLQCQQTTMMNKTSDQDWICHIQSTIDY